MPGEGRQTVGTPFALIASFFPAILRPVRMIWLKEYTLTLGLGLALAALAVNALLAHANIDALAESNRRVTEANDHSDAADAVLQALTDAETGYRGYVITGSEDFLRPYTRGTGIVHERVAALQDYAATDAERDSAATVARLVDGKLAEMQRAFDLVQAGRHAEAVEVVRTGDGRRIMEEVRAAIGAIKTTEAVNLKRRADEARSMLAWSKTTNRLAAAIGAVLAVVATLLILRDMAARERAKVALQRANEELEQNVAERTVELRRSNRALEEFASVASHDLQEPLRKIQQFGDRLDTKLGPSLDETNRDYLRRMLDAAGRMRALITALLTYSRVSTKMQQFARVNLNDVVHGVVGDLDGRLQQAEGRVEVGILPEVDAEPTQMRQLFQNLIGNALKFQKPGVPPVVRVAGRLVDGDGEPCIVLQVADNGVGFDEKYSDRIFDLFQRLHGRSEYEGTGMGLAIVRKIVEQHGGTVAAKSRPGEGATFVVTLPAPTEPPTQSARDGSR